MIVLIVITLPFRVGPSIAVYEGCTSRRCRTLSRIDIYTHPMETGLRNRVAIVAASSKGIGRATALAFAAEGANLAICARHAEPLNLVAEEARRLYGVEVYHRDI